MRPSALTPGSEPQLTKPADVQDAIRGFKAGKAPRPNSISNRALKHLPLSVVFLLVGLFNAIFQIQYFSPPGKMPACFPSSYPGRIRRCPRRIDPYACDTTGRLFEQILLTRISFLVSGRGPLRNEQFVFRPKYSTALQLTSHVERVQEL
jgi:hypothetical protein